MMLNSSVLSIRIRVLGRVMKCQNEKVDLPRIGKNESPTTRANTGIRRRRRTRTDTASRSLVLYA
jgi:hypothetical protein